MKSSDMLKTFVALMGRGAIRVVDLTETLTPDFPTIQIPPEFGQPSPFRQEVISRFDERGPLCYWNNFTVSEHTGTHFDAPIHWVTGRDLERNAVDTIDPRLFIAPACVVDCSREVAADRGFLLTRDFLEAWEERHGRIPAGSWVLMRSDWRRIADPANYTNLDDNGPHSPGPDAEAVLWMIEERDVLGFGTECIGTDAGQAFLMDPPFPCHHYMHGAGKFGLQCLTNLDLLPPTGALVFAAPLKIEQGSGSPLRVIALVPQD